SACLMSCADAGACGAGTTCRSIGGAAPWCVPSCTSTSQCTGRFFADCLVFADAGGFCVPRSCASDTDCPSALHLQCVRPLYCCPLGAPCAAPRPGVCVP